MDYKPLDEITVIKDTTCVICLELLDSLGASSKQKSKMTRTLDCDCNYYLHISCFDQWLQDKPTDELNCLVCGSAVELIVPCRKQCEICIKDCDLSTHIGCLLTVGAIFFIYLFVVGP